MKTIYRPQSVQPDLDDVLVRPNMARAAENLRMASGEEDTNLGITAIRGNRVVPVDDGRTRTLQVELGIVVAEEVETIFSAFWSEDLNHEIRDNQGQVIARGQWLNFQRDSFVSMAFVDGKLYFTDSNNPPRKLNVEKARNTWGNTRTSTDVYPPEPPEWVVARVKRQGAFAPTAETVGSGIITQDFNPQAPLQGYQFAYYYIYDDNENSRLSPYSPVVFTTKGATVTVVGENEYLRVAGIIKQIVFCYRLGNNGTWYELKRINTSSQVFTHEISDMRRAPRNPVPGELLLAQADDVPLISKWNSVVENRIVDVNYKQGYDRWDGLSLSVDWTDELRFDPYFEVFAPIRTFKAGGQLYNFGIELLDESGRRSSVINQQTIITPEYEKWYVRPAADSDTSLAFGEGNGFFDKDSRDNIWQARLTVKGEYPDWAKYMRVVYSRNQSVNTFYRTQAKMLFWYTDNGQDFFVLNSTPTTQGGVVLEFEADGQKKYEGIVVFLAQDEPFEFDANKINYLDLIGAVHLGAMDNKSNPQSPRTESYSLTNFEKIAKKYRITKVEENKLFITLTDQEKLDWFTMNYLGNPPIGLTPSQYRFYTTSLDIELSIQKDTEDPFYYQATAFREINRADSQAVFSLRGDCYFANFKKRYRGVSTPPARTLLINEHDPPKAQGNVQWGAGAFDIYGTYVAMNPTNIYNQFWDSDIGQSSVVLQDEFQGDFPNNLLVSNPLLIGTKTNGLSQVSALDTPEPFSLEMGALTGIVSTTGMQNEPGVVTVIGANAVQSVYLRANEIQTGRGNTDLTVATALFGSRNALQGRMGSSAPWSIQRANNNYVYWWSDKVSDIIRRSGEGLQALGATHGFGNQLAIEIGQSNNVSLGYDSYYEEVILINRDTGIAYVYSEKYKTYQPKRTFTNNPAPRFLASLFETQYFLQNGNFWVSDGRRAPMGSFFGQVPKAKLKIIANDNYAITKLWQHIELYCDMPELITLTTPDGKFTTLEPFEMEDIKDRIYGSFRCDINSNSGINGKYNGSLIESNLCSIEIIWNFATFDINKFKINQIVVGAVPAIAQ
jgi:hypothetical protein